MQPPSDTTPPTDNLQFDRAEYSADPAAPAVAMCGICHNTLRDRYFDINGQPACDACHERTLAEMNRGSRIGRALKALLLGFIAALVGAAIYFGVAALTGYQIGIIAIVLGLIVGVGVRIGSNGRGGAFYQALAILLTYFAISLSYVSLGILEMARNPESLLRSEYSVSTLPDDDVGPDAMHAPNSPASRPAEAQTADSSPEQPAAGVTPGTSDWENMSAGERTVAIGLIAAYIAAIMFGLPIMSAVEQPIGFLIIGIALWQAWATNKGAKLRIAGPFAVVGTAPPTAPASPPPLPPGSPDA